MSLFDDLFGSVSTEELELDERDSFVAIALLIAGADGHMSDEEISVAGVKLGLMRLFRGHELGVERMYHIVQRHGAGPIIEAAKTALSAELRETAFSFAVDIALSDGYLDDAEKEYLAKLYQGLELSKDTAVKIIQVMEIKNRG